MKPKIQFYYKKIFLYSSLQYMGNVEEYFAKHAQKLIAFVLMPRQQPNASLLRVYLNGVLSEEKSIRMSSNIFLYYFLWYFYQIYFLLTCFSRNEKIVLITFHPISFFGMLLQKTLRKITFVYWVGDYFPPVNISLILFEKLKKYFNSRVLYVCYLSDMINEKLNGKIINSFPRKTVMWGMLPKRIARPFSKKKFTVLFVGVIKSSQGLEFLFDFLKENKDYSAKLIGICTGDLYQKYSNIIKENNIEDQVFFPNRFFSEQELEKISKMCQVGIAVYDVDETSATYYTDPGKVKTYASLGLPVIMSNVSAVAPFIEKFQCGRIIAKNNKDLGLAILDIKNNYRKYLKGLKRFNRYFFYETYYRKSFKFLEEL